MGTSSLANYVLELGLPAGFSDRRPVQSAAVKALIREFKEQVGGRKFLIGLLFAFVGVVEDLLSQLGMESCGDALDRHPPHETDSKGHRRNSLYIEGPAQPISLRTTTMPSRR